MKIAFASADGSTLSWQTRLQDEGHTVLVYIFAPDAKAIGDGIVPKATNWGKFVEFARTADLVFFDAASSATPGLEIGKKADVLRKMGLPLVGAGSFCNKLEDDRVFGEELAKAAGCPVPESKAFSTVSQAIAFAQSIGSHKWYFKTDKYLTSDATCGGDAETLTRNLRFIRSKYGDRIPNIVQKCIEGVALSTACWWNGMSWVGPLEGTIEHKKALNDDLGPSTGCAVNVVWYYDDENPEIAKKLGWDSFTEAFRKYQAPPGIYDINAQIDSNGKAYFLEWTPRLGIDSETTSQLLLTAENGLGETLLALAHGRLARMPVSTREIGYAVRAGVPPYPWEHCDDHDKHAPIGAPVWGKATSNLWGAGGFCGYALKHGPGGLQVADSSGLVGTGVAVENDLSVAHQRVLESLEENIRAQGLGYRTDGLAVLSEDAKKIASAGLPMPAGLTR